MNHWSTIPDISKFLNNVYHHFAINVLQIEHVLL
jgi:hypothetical protein